MEPQKSETTSPETQQHALRGFLGLIPELRNIIYHLVLVDSQPLWYRRHKASCALCPRDSTTWEHPPWATWQFPGQSRPTTIDCCRCAVRDGLGLLLVNRQIHNEAAPIFWANNTHCFGDIYHFLRDVGENMRPASRALIRHLSIVTFDRAKSTTADRRLDLWSTLSQCRDLETLEVDLDHTCGGISGYTPAKWLNLLLADYLQARGAEGRKPSKAKLRSLKSLSPAKVSHYPVGFDGDAEDDPPRMLYVKFSERLDLELASLDRNSKMKALKIFDEGFLQEARHAVRVQFFEPTRETWKMAMQVHSLRSPLDDSQPTARLRLSGSREVDVPLFGSPLGPQTLTEHNKDRAREAAYRKVYGLLTAKEELANRLAERKEKKRQRAELERQVAEAKELRKSERKRVVPAQSGQIS